MAKSAEAVVGAALADRSYAGAFAYDEQMPMKVFMGNVPCVPYPVVVDALSTEGSGEAPVMSNQEELRKAIAIDAGTCAGLCEPALVECMMQQAGANLHSKTSQPGAQACVAKAKSCYASCFAKAV